jgi:hypothetical protein
MLELNRQQQEHREQIQRQQREMSMLQARAAVTSDPAAAHANSMRSMGATVGLIGAAAAVFPQPKVGPDKMTAMQMANPANLVKAIYKYIKEGVQNLGQAGANVGSFVAGDVNSGIVKEGTSSLIQLLGDLRKMRPTSVIKDVSELPEKIVRWGDALVESQRHISRFNGTLAMTFAESERRGVLRAIASGERTGGATADLNMSLQALRDQLQPLKDSVTIVIARGLTQAVTYLSGILAASQATYTVLHALVEKVPLLNVALGAIDAKVAEMQRNARGNAASPIRRVFEDSAKRDVTKRLGVPRR